MTGLAGAIVTLRNNKNLRLKRRSYKDISDTYTNAHHSKAKEPKKYSQEQKNKSEYLKYKVKERKKIELIVIIAFTLVCTAASVWFVIWMANQ